MARDYGTRRSSRQRGSGPQQFLVIIVTFLLGYLTASVFDVATISQWLNHQVLAQHEAKESQTKPAAQQAQTPPKPKFEFYTLLTNEKGTPAHAHHVNATANRPAVVASAKPPIHTSPTATGTTAITAAANNSVKPQVATRQPAAVKIAEAKPVAPAQTGKGNYLVQVAAFKTRNDAEHMKGLLILKGFDVAVVPVTNARGNWFRVVVGPYPNRMLAQKAQITLAKNERLHGMVTGG